MKLDHFTSTVDGAAAYERGRALSDLDPSDFRPTLTDLDADEAEAWWDSVLDAPEPKDGI